MILLAIGLTGFASATLSASPSFPLFAVLAVVLGAAAGLYFTAGTAFLISRFTDTGRALGIHEIGASTAGLFAPIASGYAAVTFGWRAGPLVPVAVAAVVFVLFLVAEGPAALVGRSSMVRTRRSCYPRTATSR